MYRYTWQQWTILHEMLLMWPHIKTTQTHVKLLPFMNEPFLQLKGIVHPKLKLLSFTHLQVVLKMYEFLCWTQNIFHKMVAINI